MPRSVVAVASLVLLFAATTAFGAKPIREPVFFEDFVAEDVCPFPVLIETTANREFVTIFSDGRVQVTGQLFARVTNLESGESLDIHISGPALIAPEERIFGRGLFILFPEDVTGPGLILTAGRIDVIRGEDGFIDDLVVRGHTGDLCEALAA
jgi:hypothetical protein